MSEDLTHDEIRFVKDLYKEKAREAKHIAEQNTTPRCSSCLRSLRKDSLETQCKRCKDKYRGAFS